MNTYHQLFFNFWPPVKARCDEPRVVEAEEEICILNPHWLLLLLLLTAPQPAGLQMLHGEPDITEILKTTLDNHLLCYVWLRSNFLIQSHTEN